MTTLIIIVSVIVGVGAGVALLGILLFIQAKKLFQKEVERSDREWEERKKEHARKVQQMDERYEQRVKGMRERK